MNKRVSIKPATRQLFFLLCIVSLLYGLSFLYRPVRTAVFSSSLILPQDFREVQELTLSVPRTAEPVEMGRITFTKSGNRFLFHTPNGSYPVRQESIERLFSFLSLPQSFITVSQNPRDYRLYLLEDERAVRITLVRKDKTLLADIFFGTTDATGTGRYVRTGRSLRVFLINNGIEPFLTIAAPFWLDLQLYKSLFHGTGIQGLEYGHQNIFRNEENETHFHALELFLERYSAIGIYSAPVLQSPQTEQVRLNLGDGSELLFSYTPLQSGDYVFFDNRSSNAYLISGYTCDQLRRHIENIAGAIFK